ncbi:MAG: hypothetical protein IKE76_13240 [Clostridia bacterium]|nr:hypothetical protein [Clostridia bacterium]
MSGKKNKAAARGDRAAELPRPEDSVSRCPEALRDGRAAILPEWLQEGRTVWFWRECWCFDKDLCADSVTSACPFNSLGPRDKEKIHQCARRHPVLDSTEIWAVSAVFERSGVSWCINDAYTVKDCLLRGAFFPSRLDALEHRPEEVAYG